jgi:hypothetical protein
LAPIPQKNIKNKKPEVSHLIFHIVTKNMQKQHITSQVEYATMKKNGA